MDFSWKSFSLLVFMGTVFPSISYLIEKASATTLSRNMNWYLAGINMLVNLAYPVVVIQYFNLHPLRATYMMIWATA